ncbi:MAG: hypothetical protein MJ244_01190 [Clostridia bacterium]|nr:hypothetical protein [Clostridia bacterium]
MRRELQELLDEYIDTFILPLEIKEEISAPRNFAKRAAKLSAPAKYDDEVEMLGKYDLAEEETFMYEERSEVDMTAFIDRYKDKYNDFQTILFDYIDKKGVKDSDIYNKANIDRKLFSKIRAANYHPSKNTVIKLAFALELSEDDMDSFLESASYSLPKNNEYDLIIRFCFLHKIFNLNDVNELLDSHNCDILD